MFLFLRFPSCLWCYFANFAYIYGASSYFLCMESSSYSHSHGVSRLKLSFPPIVVGPIVYRSNKDNNGGRDRPNGRHPAWSRRQKSRHCGGMYQASALERAAGPPGPSGLSLIT